MQLEQERFEAWLWSQPDRRVIEAGIGSCCFLCSFIKETTGLKTAWFSGWDRWFPSDTSRSLALPDWAINLIDPEELRKLNEFYIIDVVTMKSRYIKLFGDPFAHHVQPATMGADNNQTNPINTIK